MMTLPDIPRCITSDLLFDNSMIMYLALRLTLIALLFSTSWATFRLIGYLNLCVYFLNCKILRLITLLFIPFTTVWTSGSSGIYKLYFLVYKMLNK